MEFILSPTDLTEEFPLVLFNEGRVSTKEDVDDNTERPHVGLGVIGKSLKNFWGNISGSSTLSTKTVGCRTLLGESKVGNFDHGVIIIGKEEKILRLEITMGDGSFMTVSDTIKEDFAYITSFLFVVVRLLDDAAVNERRIEWREG